MRILNELVAFANTRGGQLIIGVNDDLNISGVKHSDEDVFLLRKLISEHIYPDLPYKLETIPLNKKKDLIIIDVAEGEKKPFYVNENQGSRKGIAYIRLRDESIKAGKILRMLMNSKYEAKPNAIKIEGDVARTFKLMHEKERVSFEEIKIALGKPKRSVELLLVKLLRLNLIGFDLERQDEFYLKEPE